MIIVCHAIKKILMKQRFLNIIETKNENVIVIDVTNEKKKLLLTKKQ